jgi:hypothetical protein
LHDTHSSTTPTNKCLTGMGDMSSMMGGAGGDFGGIDFSKLGGGDAMDADDADDGDEDEDEEMPELEGEEEGEESKVASGETGASATKTASKIEEVN